MEKDHAFKTITMKISNQEIYTNITRQKLDDVQNKQIETNQEKKTAPNVDKIEISHVIPNNADRTEIPTEIEMAKQDIINEIKEHPDIKKYQTIKEQVQSGTYEIDTEETAKAIIHKGSFDKLV